ncbi:MAG: hypothetical protein J6U42_04335, partial [Lachnospiraceae bacterium]|nr:hypothetical protein [Lachnospiraceae bacterium]
GDEILLGDSDFDHRVYGRLRNKQYENVSVLKEAVSRKRAFASQIESALPSYRKMAEKCDRLTAVWDGESPEVLVCILLVLSLKKECRLYHLPSGRNVFVRSVADIQPFVPERTGWSSEDMEEVLRTCGFEDQMIEHTVKDGILCEKLLTKIICGAPIALKKKRELFEKLQKKNNLNYEAFVNASKVILNGGGIDLVEQEIVNAFGSFGSGFTQCIGEIDSAELSLKISKFYLFYEWYDLDVFMEKSEPEGMFDSIAKVNEHIRKKIEHYKEDENGEWYRLEAWEEEPGIWDAPLVHTYDYYIYRGEICWFEKFRAEKQEDGIMYYRCERSDFLWGGRCDLTLETPFKAGDIVFVDCRPFGPAFHAVVTEAHDQFDCCMPQIFYCMPGTDKWTVDALKHKMFYKAAEMVYYLQPLSPLYRLRSVNADELSEEDDLLLKVSAYLEGSEEKAHSFWKAWRETGHYEMTEEEVRKRLL